MARDRRSRMARRRWLRVFRRAQGRHDKSRRREYRAGGNRDGANESSGGRRVRGYRHPLGRMGANREGVRRRAQGTSGWRAGACGVLPIAARELQASREYRVHRCAAEKSARENPAQGSARTGRRHLTPRRAKKETARRTHAPGLAGAVEVSFASGCVTATLRYVGARAAITPAMAVQLLELIEQVEDDEEARILAITAAGASFCTGFEPGVDSRLVESLAVLSKPTVAIINGDAFDEGLELAMAADIRVAISTARFAITHLKRGTMPHFGATQRLPRLIGAANALRMMLTGTALGANDAMRTGLVTYLAKNRTELAKVSGRVAEALLSHAPVATRLGEDAVLK